MAPYRIEVKQKAYKELARIQPSIGTRILNSIEALISNPRPRQSRKLAESENSYRLRVGDYRIIYKINETEKLITVFRIAHRREAYR